MPRYVKYPDWLVAKVKGARKSGMQIKHIAKHANLKPEAVRELIRPVVRQNVEPDMSLGPHVGDWFRN